MDRNRKHFPSLLISCVICSIILFVIALILSTIYQRKLNSKKTSLPRSNIKPVSDITEEQQIEAYLTNNEQEQ